MAGPAGPGFRFPNTYAKSRIEDDDDNGVDLDASRARQSRVFAQTLRQQMEGIQATPMYTPEQQMARNYENDKNYKLGLVMSMMGGEGLQQTGGTMFKHALAQRTPTMTEHGMANPLTGEFTYNPEYQRSKLQARVDAAELAAARDEDRASDLREARAARKAAAGEARAERRWLMQNKPDQSAVVIVGPDGVPRWGGRAAAIASGAETYPPGGGGGQASEGERKAGTLLGRLDFSRNQLRQAIKDDPSAEVSTITNKGISQIPMVGEDLANIAQSPARQRVEAAQLDILDAALTLGTGAAYTKEQLKGYARSYFPQPGDDATTLADKKARLDNVIKTAEIAAGRAGPNQPAKRVPGTPVAAPGAAPPARRISINDLPP